MLRFITALSTVVMFATASFSNPAISAKHKEGSRNGARITCMYCHGTAKIEKRKGQIQGQKLNGTRLARISSCNGAGCHK